MISLAQPVEPTEQAALFARYAIHSRAEVLFLLRTIQKRKLLVNLDLPASRHCVITSLLAVDEVENILILDIARDATLNRALLAGSRAEFRCSVDGVAVWFVVGAVQACLHGGLPALRAALPNSLVRLQRREHFRVTLPFANPVQCIVPALEDDALSPVIAQIIDISCGGVALAESSGRLQTAPGDSLPECRLMLPRFEMIVTTLEILNSAQIRLQNGAYQTRFGCRFSGLSNDRLASLQRFIMDLECARRNGS